MSLTVACVNWNNYQGRGAEYVERMESAIKKCITRDYTFRVFTEKDTPAGIEGWWTKLWLFSDEAFPRGERVIFIDLDMMPIGSLDFLADYRGSFAALRDWYNAKKLGSALMLWEAGTLTDIWDKWNEAGRPLVVGGDQTWIWMMHPCAVRLQDEFPGKFVSMKVRPSMVCFHGHPRPHEIGWRLQ